MVTISTQAWTQPALEDHDGYRLERRDSNRHALSGRVTALQTRQWEQGAGKRICSLQLSDMSDRGMGVLTQEAMELGSRISIFFPPHGAERGFDMIGRVVRCIPRVNGHEVGIRLEKRLAA